MASNKLRYTVLNVYNNSSLVRGGEHISEANSNIDNKQHAISNKIVIQGVDKL